MSSETRIEQAEPLFLDDVEEAPKPFLVRHATLLLLILILAVGAYFRFIGRDFDQSTNQHPDERAIVDRTMSLNWPTSFDQVLDPKTSPLNLRANGRYPWGSLPVYVARASAWGADIFVGIFKPDLKGYYLRDYHGVQLVGRTVASIFDLITILLVFLIGRRLYSARVGLVAAALVALAATHIQIAHFYISEPFLVAFMMAALYFSVVLLQRPSWWAASAAGFFIGLSVASKVTSALIFLMVIAAVVLRAAYRHRSRKVGAELDDPVGVRPATPAERQGSLGGHLGRGLRYVALAALFALLGFAITEPYALWQFDWPQFRPQPGQPDTLQESVKNLLNSNPWGRVIVEEAGIQSGEVDIPYTRQYVGTVPVLYHFEQLVFWGVGVIPGLLMLAGLGVGIWLALRRRPAEIMLLSFALPYFLTILIGETKWMRYMLPMVPVLAILAAALLARGSRMARHRWPRLTGEGRLGARAVQRSFFAALTAAALAFAFLWAVAFSNIYSQPHSRVQAAQWANANLDGGSMSHEGWDDTLPMLDGRFEIREDNTFHLYDDRAPDDELNYLKGLFSRTDYIVLTSNRLYGSIPRLPWRYPIQTKFYQLLFAEKLGYVRVHTQHVTPELLGLRFDDQLADESFTVYDHPRVDIFRKVSTLTDEQFRILFSTALERPIGEYSTARHGKVSDDKSLMFDRPLSELPEVGDYSWNPLAQESTQWIGVALWVLAVYLLGFAALPLAFVVLRRLPDRGYAFAKLAGLLLVSWGVWLLASGRLVPFTVWSVWLLTAAVAALGLLLWRLGVGAEIRQFLREKRSLVLFYEGLFLLSFALMLFVRMLNPDVWHTVFGGEKTMEFGFLNATLRSPWMPPADPFFSGGYINYYYHGQFIIACLIKMIGVDPAIAFNLGLAIIYSLTFVAAASIVYNIVALSRALRGSGKAVSRTAMVFGVLGSVLMLVIGNLSHIVQLVMVLKPDATATLIEWGRALGFSTEGFTRPFSEFYFWPPSRVIPGTINEFPYWSFLYGDLHPHLIDMPFTLLSTALAINLALAGRFIYRALPGTTSLVRDLGDRAGAALAWLWGRGAIGWLTFTVAALALGGLFVTNSWDFPTFAGLTGGAVLIALLLSRRTPGTAAEREASDAPLGIGGGSFAALIAFLSVGAVALFAVLTYLPFFLNFKAFFTRIMPLVDGGVIPGTSAIMHRTSIWEFLAVWGFFVFIAASYLLVRLWRFPWRAAVADLLGAAPAGSTQRRPEPSATTAAFTSPASGPRPFLAWKRAPRLALALSQAGSSGGASSVSFQQAGSIASGPDSEQETPAVADAPEGLAGKPAEDIEDEALSMLVGRLPSDTDAAEPANSPQDEAQSESLPRIPEDTGEGESAGTPTQNWVAVAHTEAFRESEVRPERRASAPGVIPLWLGLALLAGSAALAVLQVVTGQITLALLVALIGGLVGTLLSTTRSSAALTGGLLLAVGLIVALGVEVVYLADHNAGGDYYRMNTVFKFYIQVWVLLALGCAVAVYYILFGLRDERTSVETTQAALPVEVDAQYPALAGVSDLPPRADDTAVANGSEVSPPQAADPPRPAGNWLVWSLEEIASPPAAESDSAPDLPEVTGQATTAAEEVMPPLPSRRVEIEEVSAVAADLNGLPVESAESQAPDSAPVLHLHWTFGKIVWAAAFALLLLIVLMFPILGTPDKAAERIQLRTPFGTLSGLSYMQNATFSTEAAPGPIQMRYDLQGINWLNRNVAGLRTIAELPMGYYREGGMRVSSNTGLPMVVGGLHQEEQRAEVYARLVGDRQRDMSEFYSTTDVQKALTIISKYDIDYIYVGQLELARAGRAGAGKFDQMADPEVGILSKVFESDNPQGVPGTTIYRVNRSGKLDPRTLVGAPVEGSGVPGISITPLPTSTPIPPPTPPVDDPVLKQLIADVAANPNDREKRKALVDWYVQNGYHLAAAQELEILVQQNPADVALRHMLGDMYNAAGMPDKALAAWEDAVKVAPDNPDAHNKVGIAYMERRRYEDAAKSFEAAVKANPAFVESWFHLGEVHERRGDLEAAKRAYQAVIDNSREPNSWKDAAQKRLGDLK